MSSSFFTNWEVSYVTGAHNMKFGYQGGFNNPSQTYQYFNEVIHVRLNNGVPNRLTQVITTNDSPARIKVTRNLWPTSFYGQDQWTRNRLTLQGGVRYDFYMMNYPESKIGGPGYTLSAQPEIVYPSRSTQQVKWHDVTPRMGAAYDVFGDGRTAFKVLLGRYIITQASHNSTLGGLSAVGNIGDGALDQLALTIAIPTDKLGVAGGMFRFRNTWNHTEVTDPTTGEILPISNVRASQSAAGSCSGFIRTLRGTRAPSARMRADAGSTAVGVAGSTFGK